MIDKSELPYAILTIAYLLALIIANGMYIVFWVSVLCGVWMICYAICWVYRFFRG